MLALGQLLEASPDRYQGNQAAELTRSAIDLYRLEVMRLTRLAWTATGVASRYLPTAYPGGTQPPADVRPGPASARGR
jgi:hypothetical protein